MTALIISNFSDILLLDDSKNKFVIIEIIITHTII